MDKMEQHNKCIKILEENLRNKPCFRQQLRTIYNKVYVKY